MGLGNIAHQFVKDLLLVEGCELVAVGSRSQIKTKEFVAQHELNSATLGSYQDLIHNENVDIIYIATPHPFHESWCIKALEAGKHVLCEKPLGVNQMEVQNMISASKKNNRFLMEALWSRFNPSIMKTLEMIENGALGEINYINADFSFYRNDPSESRMLNMDLAGGSLLDMGVYPLFLAYTIMGMPDEITSKALFHETGADLQTCSIFSYKDGMAQLMSGFKSQSDMRAKICGTKGHIEIEPIWHEAQGLTFQKNDASSKEYISLPTYGKGFTYEIKECLNCIKQGTIESKLWSHQNSLDIISLTDKIRKQINLKYPFEL